MINKKFIIILILFLIPIVEIFYPFIIGQVVIINEFLDIPLSTIDNQSYVVIESSPSSLHLGYKTLIGYFFHHHMNFLLPASELFENFNTSIHQYGILTSFIIGGLSKIFYTNISLNSYFSILYSMYIIFYTSLFIFIWKTINNKILIIPFALLLYLFIYIVGFESYYMTPTLNPIRQILFPIIFLISYKYLKDFETKKLYYILTLLFISFFINSQFTILLIISLIITKISLAYIDNLSRQQKKNLQITLIFFFILLIFNLSFSFNSSNSFSEYFLILGPELGINSYILVLIFICVLPSICIRAYGTSNFNFLIFISCYFGLSMVYYVWNPSMNHFSPIAWTWAIAIIIFCDTYFKEKIKPNYQPLIFLLIAFTLTCYEARVNFFITKDSYYNRILDISSIHKWNTKRSEINTTIDSKYINQACNIFKRYSTNKEITMLSLHDSYLPFICGFSHRNFSSQVALNLPTKKEEIGLVNFFKNKEIEIVFVDKFLLDTNNNSAFDLSLIELSGETGRSKIMYIKYFSKITDRILKSNNFYKIDESEKLMVFKRGAK